MCLRAVLLDNAKLMPLKANLSIRKTTLSHHLIWSLEKGGEEVSKMCLVIKVRDCERRTKTSTKATQYFVGSLESS